MFAEQIIHSMGVYSFFLAFFCFNLPFTFYLSIHLYVLSVLEGIKYL